jgi:hypothetical protein
VGGKSFMVILAKMEIENVTATSPADRSEDSFTNKDGLMIFTRQWKTEHQQPK